MKLSINIKWNYYIFFFKGFLIIIIILDCICFIFIWFFDFNIFNITQNHGNFWLVESFKVPPVSNYGNKPSLCHNKLLGVMSLRIRRISAVMYENLESSEDIKIKATKEMEMTTDLLAGAGITEPKLFKIKTGLILKAFLLSCTVKFLCKTIHLYIYSL